MFDGTHRFGFNGMVLLATLLAVTFANLVCG